MQYSSLLKIQPGYSSFCQKTLLSTTSKNSSQIKMQTSCRISILRLPFSTFARNYEAWYQREARLQPNWYKRWKKPSHDEVLNWNGELTAMPACLIARGNPRMPVPMLPFIRFTATCQFLQKSSDQWRILNVGRKKGQTIGPINVVVILKKVTHQQI